MNKNSIELRSIFKVVFVLYHHNHHRVQWHHIPSTEWMSKQSSQHTAKNNDITTDRGNRSKVM